jgi:ectoine hydroxylase-related dioxygenase (phytanoyl-CoA dioxygenase family)
VSDLIGPELDCFVSQFIFKNHGALGQPWHQDSYYFAFNTRPQVGIWLAVTEATLDNGCLHVMPGSHRERVHEHVPDRRPHAQYGYTEIVDYDTSKSMPVLMQPGDLLVFHSHLMHRSTDNLSGGIRAAMVWHYARSGTIDQTREKFGHQNPAHDFMKIERHRATED